MKKSVLLILISFIWVGLVSQNKPDPNFLKDLSENKIANFENGINYRNNGIGQNYDIVYHRLEWEIDPEIYYIKGVVTTYFIAVEDSVSEISFELETSLNIDSVIFHENNMNYSHINGILSVFLADTINENHFDSISIYYQGLPGSSGFGSFQQTWHENSPIVSTLSEPYGAKDWWPCKQSLTDKIDSIDIFVRAKSEFQVASNGILISEIIDGNNKTTHWKHNYPIAAYLIAIAVTNYSIYSDYVHLDNGDSLEILNYVFFESLVDAQLSTQNTIGFIELYNELFIEYPFVAEKYGHAQFSSGGGMEHQTMSFMGNFSWQLQAHELAHQWFGDYITCGSWEDIWLNEGFATYLTGLAYLYLNPAWWDLWKQTEIEKVISQAGGSVIVDDTTSVGRIFDSRLSYAKGAMVLHMLRWELGDSIFYQAIRDYLEDPFLIYNYAKTPDLINHFEFVADTSLSNFFADWYYGEGYPIYSVEWEQDEMKNVMLKIFQSQSHSSVDFFEMHIEIKFYGEGKDSSLIFHNTDDAQMFSASLDFMIDSIKFDPEQWIITSQVSIINSIEKTATSSFAFYPNPASEKIFIENQLNLSNFDVAIFSIDGKKLYSKNVNNYEKIVEISLSNLSSGLYFLEIKTNTFRFSEKVFVLK